MKLKRKNLIAITISLLVIASFVNFSLIESKRNGSVSFSFLRASAQVENTWQDCEDGIDVEGKGYCVTSRDCPCPEGLKFARICWYCGAGCDVSRQQFCSDVCD